MKHIISNSDGTYLQFEENDGDLWKEYKNAEQALNTMFYRLLRSRNGIWASNQGKYVYNSVELTRFDNHYMEQIS